MSKASRTKGQGGEREVAGIVRDLTGWDVRRRVRQHAGDSDLEGVPGWSVEVKRHATATRGDIRGWWDQAVRQAKNQARPVLFFRRNRDEWRAVWCPSDSYQWSQDYQWTHEGSIEAWAMVARENVK